MPLQFKPLINLMREVQNNSDYLQADESRMYVLKEDGKTAQSDKWMWLTPGKMHEKPSCDGVCRASLIEIIMVI
jgi:hypothetical protein